MFPASLTPLVGLAGGTEGQPVKFGGPWRNTPQACPVLLSCMVNPSQTPGHHLSQEASLSLSSGPCPGRVM